MLLQVAALAFSSTPALDAGLVMKWCFAVLAGDGSQASEGRETAFPPLPASPIALSLTVPLNNALTV